MSDLHLDSLEIKNFRCFEHLTIEKLGRVNLLVGKNGVGKTALLEGLWLMASNGAWPVIHKILYERNELVRYGALDSAISERANSLDRHEQFEALQNLFYGRHPKSHSISDGINWGSEQICGLSIIGNSKHDFVIKLLTDSRICFEYGDSFSIVKDELPALPAKDILLYRVIEQSKESKTVLVPLKGLDWQALCTYWDDIALTDKEEAIIQCLQLIDPEISRFTFKGENMQNRVRYPAVKTGRFGPPIPLAQIGEGIQRIFGLALAMATASGGFLLVDEIETGLYHRVQADVWRAVFKLAKQWDIQVFATTHSWNCIEAFQEAAAENDEIDAMLYRLQQKRDGTGIIATGYDKHSLDVITRQGIEVR